ncbi:hypothetical protein AHF37_04422 [Paragonimus kellicotti]|nr:hypothetical protein AHF37_04422 [Paragonimus kellicotti]
MINTVELYMNINNGVCRKPLAKTKLFLIVGISLIIPPTALQTTGFVDVQLTVHCDDRQRPILQATEDSHKDLVHPNETHFQGVPFFIQHPKPLYYTMKDHPATIECVAEPVSHAVIECAEQAIPYKGPDESGRLKVTRLDSHNRPDPNGNRWRLELQIRAKEVEEWFDSYVCRCEAWNKIVELQRPKKVISRAAVVYELSITTNTFLLLYQTVISEPPKLFSPVDNVNNQVGKTGKSRRSSSAEEVAIYVGVILVLAAGLLFVTVIIVRRGTVKSALVEWLFNPCCIQSKKSRRMEKNGKLSSRTPAPLRGPSQSTTVYDTIDSREPENNQATSRPVRMSSFATPPFLPLPPPPPTLSYSTPPTPDNFHMIGQCVTPKNLSGSSTRTSASTQYFFSGLCQPNYATDNPLTMSSPHTVESSSEAHSSGDSTTNTTNVSSSKEDSGDNAINASGLPPLTTQNRVTQNVQETIDIAPSVYEVYSRPGQLLTENSSEMDYGPDRSYKESTNETGGLFNRNGGVLHLPNSGISLIIPPTALQTTGFVDVQLTVHCDDRQRPILQDHQTILSPIVQLGPTGLHFSRQVMLVFPHCADLAHGDWLIRLYGAPPIPDVSPQQVTSIETNNLDDPKAWKFTASILILPLLPFPSDLERKFQLEPTSTELPAGRRLELSCIPPEGKPSPEVSMSVLNLHHTIFLSGCH